MLSDEKVRTLQKYDRPSNVTELKNFWERSFFLDCHHDTVIHDTLIIQFLIHLFTELFPSFSGFKLLFLNGVLQ